jgi:hypothetical protein
VAKNIHNFSESVNSLTVAFFLETFGLLTIINAVQPSNGFYVQRGLKERRTVKIALLVEEEDE